MVTIFNFIVSLGLKIPLKKYFKVLKNNALMILFIVICNIFFSDIYDSLLVGIRLLLVIDYTFLMGYYFDITKIRTAFYYLFYPMKIFKIDVDNLALIITISLTFIPILIDEVRMIKIALGVKGLAFNFKNLITRPHIYLITFLNGLFDRLDDLEKSLSLKGF